MFFHNNNYRKFIRLSLDAWQGIIDCPVWVFNKPFTCFSKFWNGHLLTRLRFRYIVFGLCERRQRGAPPTAFKIMLLRFPLWLLSDFFTHSWETGYQNSCNTCVKFAMIWMRVHCTGSFSSKNVHGVKMITVVLSILYRPTNPFHPIWCKHSLVLHSNELTSLKLEEAR